MSYSLYDTIRSSRYENCVILTYSINLNLYESIIWKRLHTNGCHNNVLFVDGNEFDQALLHDKRTLEYLGKGYLIYPIYSIAAFHPKVILLTNKTSGKLIISSANVTVAALTRHSEIINEFDYDESNEEYLYLFNDCWNYLMAMCQEVPSYIMAQIEQLYETTPWLNKTGARGSDFAFIANPKYRKDSPSSIYDVLSSLISASTIDELTILSPFFDSDLRLLKQLKKKFDIVKTNFIIDPHLSLDPLARPILSKETNIYRFSNPLDRTKYRSLHAKAMYFKADPDRYLLCGSMNFTSNAMGIPFKQNNYEAGILYKSDNDNYFQMLGLADLVQNNNRLTINDLKFEKRELDETKNKYSIQITWVEFLYGEITINIKPSFLQDIKNLEIYFYDSADNNTGIVKIKDYLSDNNHISSYIQDRYIIESSNCIELHAIYNDGSKAISNRAVLNKIETLRELTAKSDFTKKLKKLVRVLPTGQDYEIMLDLLSYFLFDSYEQYLKKNTIRKVATVTEKYNNDNEEPRKLDMNDIISTEPKKEHMGLSSMYGDQGGDVIKEIFINSFLKDNKNGSKLIVDKVAEDYLEEKNH